MDKEGSIPKCPIKTPIGEPLIKEADPAAFLPPSHVWGSSGVRVDERHKIKIRK